MRQCHDTRALFPACLGNHCHECTAESGTAAGCESHLAFRCFQIISHGQTGECLGTYLVAYRVLMLHFAFNHYATGLKAPMRVVWTASCCKVCWSLQPIQHEVWIHISQSRRAYRRADGHASTVRQVRALNNRQGSN